MCDSTESITVGDLEIPVRRKDIKHVHIAVYPPDGHVRISAPVGRRSFKRSPDRAISISSPEKAITCGEGAIFLWSKKMPAAPISRSCPGR